MKSNCKALNFGVVSWYLFIWIYKTNPVSTIINIDVTAERHNLYDISLTSLKQNFHTKVKKKWVQTAKRQSGSVDRVMSLHRRVTPNSTDPINLEFHQPPIQWVSGDLSLGWSGRDVKLTTHLHLVPRWKNAWSYTSTPQYVFMAWCLVKHRDNFTFTLLLLVS
jgi:hypothetical protein